MKRFFGLAVVLGMVLMLVMGLAAYAQEEAAKVAGKPAIVQVDENMGIMDDSSPHIGKVSLPADNLTDEVIDGAIEEEVSADNTEAVEEEGEKTIIFKDGALVTIFNPEGELVAKKPQTLSETTLVFSGEAVEAEPQPVGRDACSPELRATLKRAHQLLGAKVYGDKEGRYFGQGVEENDVHVTIDISYNDESFVNMAGDGESFIWEPGKDLVSSIENDLDGVVINHANITIILQVDHKKVNQEGVCPYAINGVREADFHQLVPISFSQEELAQEYLRMVRQWTKGVKIPTEEEVQSARFYAQDQARRTMHQRRQIERQQKLDSLQPLNLEQ